MSKQVSLTWKNSDETIIEECLLISEEDKAYVLLDDGSLLEPPDLLSRLMEIGMVVFEDDEGIFCLHPENVVNIEEL